MLDTVQKFETPEGIDLDLHAAGPVGRACAWMIDALIRGVVYWVGSILLLTLGEVGWGLMALAVFAMEWFYPVAFEVIQGATPGKRAMGLSVVQDDGTPVGIKASLTRNLLWPADFFPAFYFTGLITIALNNRFKRLGDLVAGTLVVYREKESKRVIDIPDSEPAPLPAPLIADEKSAILNFAEQSQRLTLERQIEIADILKDYTGASGTPGLHRIFGYANWLLKGSEQ